jgi:hypothetical protein
MFISSLKIPPATLRTRKMEAKMIPEVPQEEIGGKGLCITK